MTVRLPIAATITMTRPAPEAAHGQKNHPADLEAHEISESRPCIKVWSTGAVEQPAYFGETEDDQSGRDPGGKVRGKPGGSQEPGNLCGKDEDPGAHHSID